MTHRQMRRCSTLPVIREMLVKATMKCHLTPVRMTGIKRQKKKKMASVGDSFWDSDVGRPWIQFLHGTLQITPIYRTITPEEELRDYQISSAQQTTHRITKENSKRDGYIVTMGTWKGLVLRDQEQIHLSLGTKRKLQFKIASSL